MVELVGTARNLMLVPKEQQLEAAIEVVLIVGEIRYRSDKDTLFQEFKTSEFRFGSDPDGIESLAKDLLAYVAEARELLATVKKECA